MRLTNKNVEIAIDNGTGYAHIYNKLRQLEDIEEEYAIQDTNDLRRRLDLADKYGELSEQLGIDLITLFKASKDGIVFIDNETHNIRLAYNIKIDIYEKELVDVNIDEEQEPMYFKFKNYGKTWALTKEELNHE